jgi:iron complex outermembrane receptor protein
MKRLWNSILAASLGILFSLTITPLYAQPEDDESAAPPDIEELDVEEMLVTGSYIKGLSAEHLASPMQSFDRSELLDMGVFRLEDIANNLTVNTGSQNNPDAFTQNFTTGTSNLNLRGLGVASTLVLLNGRRQTYSAFTTDKGESFVDLSSLVPMIAVERLEILKDGAASLYGSDAVAGVANFHTRNTFEGLEFDVESMAGDGQGDLKLSGIFGTGSDSTHFMAAFGYLDRDGLGMNEKRLSTVEDDTSRAGFPGTFLIPINPGGPLGPTWSAVFDSAGAVPNVADFFEPLVNSLLPPVPGAIQPAFTDPQCQNIAASDDTTVPPETFPLGPCQFDFGTYYSLVPNEERTQLYTTVSHKFTDSLEWFAEAAVADIKADRRNSPSFPITTTPIVCGNGSLNNFMLDEPTGPNLDGTPYTCTGPNAVGPHPDNVFGTGGGFGVDLLFVGRVLGSGADAQITQHDSKTERLATGLGGDFNENWSWDVDITHSNNNFRLEAEDTLSNEFQLALFGLGGEGCSGNAADAGDASAGCFYFNPFGSSLPASSVDGTENTREIYDYITAPVIIDAESELQTIGAIASGSLFSLPGGDAGLAVGVQSRDESLDYDYDENSNNDGFIFFTGNPDFKGERNIKALFSELAMPFSDSFDVQLSIRSEDYEDAGDSTDPKLSAIWRIDNFTARLSRGTSFRAPSLYQQSGTQTTLQEVRTEDLGNQFIAIRAEPNPDDPLEPEEADVFNLGIAWGSEGDEGLSASLDYWAYDYSNVIIQQNPQAVLDAANAGDPQADEQVDGGATGISRITVYYDNASKLETDGVDLMTRYNWSTDNAGFYRIGLEVTKVMSYDLEDPQAGAIDGLGQRNYTNFATSMPELRANLHFMWESNRHGFNAFARQVDSYNNDQLDNNGDPRNETIDSHTTFDLQYNYQFESFGFGDEGMTLAVGGINVTDEDPPHVATNGGYDSKVHDPRGALYYVKLNVPIF